MELPIVEKELCFVTAALKAEERKFLKKLQEKKEADPGKASACKNVD